jgi:hypothetical protein
VKRATLTVLLLIFGTTQLHAWTPRTYQIIVGKAMRLMPASFQGVMLRHQEEILIACMKPDEFDEAQHTYDLQTRSGYLQQRVMELSAAIPLKIKRHVPFREIAPDFGRLAHYMADLNDPLMLDNSDEREPQYRTDFEIYLQKNIEKFPWIFEGHDTPLLGQAHLKEYIHSVAVRGAERYPRLGEAYFPNGVLVSSDTFDPRSLPFGIASLSFSRSISNAVQIWFHTWKSSNGDVTRTPFYSGSRSKTVSGKRGH